MSYREISIQIRSAYTQGWPDDASRAAFRAETRRRFRDTGWQVEEMPIDSACSDTVRNGKDALYLHPDMFGGVIQEDHVTTLQEILSGAKTFYILGVELHGECFDLTDEAYRKKLEEQTEQIDAAILRACQTKRRNLFRTGSIAEAVGKQFAIRRLTDWERSESYIAEGYVGDRIRQLVANGRLITAQTRYGERLRTATDAELGMIETEDSMQMHL